LNKFHLKKFLQTLIQYSRIDRGKYEEEIFHQALNIPPLVHTLRGILEEEKNSSTQIPLKKFPTLNINSLRQSRNMGGRLGHRRKIKFDGEKKNICEEKYL
jgi:hypothetical protein